MIASFFRISSFPGLSSGHLWEWHIHSRRPCPVVAAGIQECRFSASLYSGCRVTVKEMVTVMEMSEALTVMHDAVVAGA
ncbi:hypothetical protein GCM10018965_031500 [Nonomuraea roseola]